MVASTACWGVRGVLKANRVLWVLEGSPRFIWGPSGLETPEGPGETLAGGPRVRFLVSCPPALLRRGAALQDLASRPRCGSVRGRRPCVRARDVYVARPYGRRKPVSQSGRVYTFLSRGRAAGGWGGGRALP